jgi:hypothetical protein
MTLGALAAGAAIGKPTPLLHGMAASTILQPEPGEDDISMIATKEYEHILKKTGARRMPSRAVGFPEKPDAWTCVISHFNRQPRGLI